jgi:hypothetical protein
MPLDRRSLLKMLALAPAFTFLEPSLAHGLLSNNADQKVYILLHGMFFMEYDGDKFIVATPNCEGHRFYTRFHGQGLQDMDTDINLYNNVIGGPKPLPFEGILQLSRKADLNIDDGPVLSRASMYRCKMILPYPEKIITMRSGLASDFHPKGNIFAKSKRNIPSEIATITCLVYSAGSDDAYTQSYYAEHPHRPSLSEINMALVAAQDLCGDSFNLQIASPSSTPCIPPSDSKLPGVSQDDEYELDELFPGKPCAASKSSSSMPAHKNAKKSIGNPDLLHLDVASCPQFAITP